MACPVHRAPTPPPLIEGGVVKFQAHHVGWIVTAAFTLVATIASLWLIRKHLCWYSCKPQQRHIVRLLFMVPIYAIITLASYIAYTHATSLLLIRDAYESVVLASFFALLLQYLPGPVPPGSGEKNGEGEVLGKKERVEVIHRTFYKMRMYPDPTHQDKKHFKWLWPLHKVRARPKDGLAYLQYMRYGVLQYCIVRPGTTLAAVILQSNNLYCETSWNPKWAHVWIVSVVSISVTIAMYCLLQLYVTISEELKPYRPLLKLFAVKAVVFLTFWQGALLSGLASLDIIKDSEYMTAEDITIGFGALLQTFEMMCFAFLHVKAFSYVPYKRIALSATPSSPTSQSPSRPELLMTPPSSPPNVPTSLPQSQLPASVRAQLKNLVHAFDFSDTARDIWTGILYMFGKGAARQADEVCRRGERFREVFGRERLSAGVGAGIQDRIGIESEPEEREKEVGEVEGPRSFVRTHGYRVVPVSSSPEDDEEEKRGRASSPWFYPRRYRALPTPQTSPREDQRGSDLGLGYAFPALDDIPPISFVNAGERMGNQVRPLPPGAYIPRYQDPLGAHFPPPFPIIQEQTRWQPVPRPTVMITPPHTPPRAVRSDLSPISPRVSLAPVPQTPSTLTPRSPSTIAARTPTTATPNTPTSATTYGAPRSPMRHSSPTLSLSEDREPPSRDDSLLARVFSGATRTTAASSANYLGSDSASFRTRTVSLLSGETHSSRTGEGMVQSVSAERGRGAARSPARYARKSRSPIVYPSQPVEPPLPQPPILLSPPPQVARPLRHAGPIIQPRTQDAAPQVRPQGPRVQPRRIVLPAPLSPARYPYSTWRTPGQGQAVSPVRGGAGPVHWSPLQPDDASSESGIAGWAAGRNGLQSNGNAPFGTYAEGASSLSSLSNIEDRYPAIGGPGRQGRNN
ncbi:DUF300-domain-containing protein [Ceratobasidium sp. AG-I]|nr:DUF300-domain-containing protein [Ceratobasidium sp. AG-I]